MSESQGARVLAVLADGKPHSVPEIHRRAGTMRLNSRVADLRKQGHTIVCEHVKGKTGAAAYRYTWVDAPPQTETNGAQLTLTTDEIAPRRPEERYRLFRVRNGGAPEIVATCATQAQVGTALCLLGEEGMFDDYCVGVQDALSRYDDQKQQWVGKWLVKPWQSYGG